MRIALLAGLAAVVGAAMFIQRQPIFDDPYILFRYAARVAEGRGWEFNLWSDSANAVTSVLYVLLAAAADAIGLPILTFAAVLFFLTSWVASILTFMVLDRAGRRSAALIAAVLVAASPGLTALWGMESSLYLCLAVAALYAASVRRLALCGMCLGLLVLARPDGVIVAGSLSLVYFILDPAGRLRPREWLRLLISAFIPVLAWAVYAAAALGSILPSTLEAKIAQAESGRWAGYLSRPGLFTIVDLNGGSRVLALLFVGALVASAALGALDVFRTRRAWQPALTLALASAVVILAYGLVFRVPSYPWYYGFPLYTLLVLAGLGLGLVGDQATSATTWKRYVTPIIVLIAVTVSLAQVNRRPSAERREYVAIGEWLDRHSDPRATVAASEIGKIGWYSNRDMVDYLGLLDPKVSEQVAKGDFSTWMARYRPDYWVTDRKWIDRNLASSDCIANSFMPVFRTEHLTVFGRRDGATFADC